MAKTIALIAHFGFAICFSLAGCISPPSPYATPAVEPFEVESVAVLPFFLMSSETRQWVLDYETADIFAGELLDVRGFAEVRRPKHIPREWLEGLVPAPGTATPSAEAVLELGDRLKTDLLVVGMVTENDPFFPPRLALSIQVFSTTARGGRAFDLDRLIRSGRPIPIEGRIRSHTVVAVEKTIDSGKKDVREAVREYARAYEDDFAFAEEEDILRVSERYMRFASRYMIDAIFALVREVDAGATKP